MVSSKIYSLQPCQYGGIINSTKQNSPKEHQMAEKETKETTKAGDGACHRVFQKHGKTR